MNDCGGDSGESAGTVLTHIGEVWSSSAENLCLTQSPRKLSSPAQSTMGEKGSERHRGTNGAVYVKRGHVRVIKNSNLSHGQAGLRSQATSPVKTDVKMCHSPDSLTNGLKKGKRSHEVTALSMSPSPKHGGFGGAVSPKSGTPRSSPSLGCHYAGAKFSEPPSPDSLPKPPTHWNMSSFGMGPIDQYMEISQQLKMILKVEA